MDAVFLKVLNMSISASWLILAVMLIRVLLKKSPKWINCVLWALVAVRLLCPVSFESSLSLVPNAEPVPQEIFMMEPPENHESAVFDPVENSNLPNIPAVSVDASIETIQWKAVFATFGWMFGMAAMLVYAAISYIQVKRKVKASLYLKDRIWICDDIQTPFILGVFKPRIYIPSGTEEAQLPHIIAHENAHLKRRDHWWKPLGFLVLAIHWFNPLVWVAYILLCRDIELACDEKVIRDLNQSESIAYSEALLSCSVNRRMVMVCPLAFGEVGVKERVKRVLNYKKPAFWIIVVAVIASVALAVCFLTNPKALGDSITLIKQSTPVRGNAFTYDVSFGQNVMSGTVHAEQWSNGTCVKSSPVVLTNEVDEINILMNVRRENNSPVGVDIQVDTNEYGGSLITYFAFPENNSIIGWGCKGYELNEPVQIHPDTEKILAALVFDVGNGVRAFGTEDLIIEPERLANAEYAIVIRASFDSTNLGNENNEATSIYSSFSAMVLEIHDGYYLVEPVEGSWELSSADRIEVPIRNAHPSPEPEVGDVIEIEYSGEILETYPARITDVYGIRVIEESEQWDLIPMVMVNGTLYLDTGHESTVEARCGVMDGEITSQVDGSKKPTVDDQSNFGVGYGYQYGPTEGTIEIYMNEQWRVFATEEVRQQIQFPTAEYNPDGILHLGLNARVVEIDSAAHVLYVKDIDEQDAIFGDRCAIDCSEAIRNHNLMYVNYDGESDVRNIEFEDFEIGDDIIIGLYDSEKQKAFNGSAIAEQIQLGTQRLNQPEVVHYPAHKTLYEATPIDQIEANYDNEEFVIAKPHYENLDGEWVCGEHTYKYRLEITGRLNNAAKNTTYIVLSNTEGITFDQTWKASGLSSNLNDYFDPSVAVIVGNRLFS